MIEHTYQVLGFHHLLDILSDYASCQLGRLNCLSLRPSSNPEFIDNELMLVSEMGLLLQVKGFKAYSGLKDISPVLRKSAAEGSCLEPEEFLCILALTEACQESKSLLRSNRALYPGIFLLVADIPDVEALAGTLRRTISPNGEIKDSASPGIKRIRATKIQLRADLQKKLEAIKKAAGLGGSDQDHLVTIRDGRYVIALRTDQKWRLDGIIHQYSQTRATCFLEPVDVIQDNNQMAELLQEEKAEEYRILTGLTGMVRELADDLEYSQSIVSRLDGLYARAEFGRKLGCVRPEVGQDCGVELRGAKNPILLAMAKGKPDEAFGAPVPIDVLLDEQKNLLIVSGPNRGGKTVTLKTLGLMSLMTQAGIPIPAEEGSCLPVFNKIMADIGDEQDLEMGVSTFSAHAERLRCMVEQSDQKTLAIIDEPGTGTDPDEGVALAMAVLDFLSSQGTFIAVATHLNRLKTYGLLNQRATNAAVQFDFEKNRPTFTLKYGSPGISHALDMARDMGIPVSILERARSYLDQDEVRLNRLIDKLNRLVTEAKDEKREAEDIKRDYQEAAARIRNELAAFEAQKGDLMEAKRSEAEAVIREAKKELNQAINFLKWRKEPAQDYAIKRCAEISQGLARGLEPEGRKELPFESGELKEGQLVYHKKLRQNVMLQSLDPSGKRAKVVSGTVTVSAEIRDLEKPKRLQGSASAETSQIVSWDLEGIRPTELNIIGYRVEDAIRLIDQTIDRGLIEGNLTLNIVHGFGTGRLRDAVRAHLKGIPFVKNVCSADSRFGGDAITVVEFC
jgi:DNA mismatch repair protein MutS2